MTPKKTDFLHIGSSVRGRTQEDALKIVERINLICQVADQFGYDYDVRVQTDPKVTKDINKISFEIPEEYLNRVTQSMIDKVHGLRIKNTPYTVKQEIACHLWTMDIINRATSCIFDLAFGSTGVGFEIAASLSKSKPCLLLYPENRAPGVNINGHLNRLIVTRHWNNDIEKTLEDFFKKAQEGKDRSFRFSLSQTTMSSLNEGTEKRGFKSRSEYLRFLIERDKENLYEE